MFNSENPVFTFAKYSNAIIKSIPVEIARPSIPSIKLMALIIATIMNIVRS